MERENIYKGSTFNMKCQYCGAVLNLTDEVCPHCGRKNRAGEAYKKDYDKYQSKVNTAEKSISAQQLYSGASCNVYWSGGVYAYTRLVFY